MGHDPNPGMPNGPLLGHFIAMGIHEMGIAELIGGGIGECLVHVGLRESRRLLSFVLGVHHCDGTTTDSPHEVRTNVDRCLLIQGVLILGLAATAEAFERGAQCLRDEILEDF